MEHTLVIIKPDAVERGLVGEIIARFEAAGFAIRRMRFLQLPADLARHFYAEHMDKPHFGRLIDYMTSGPACFLELERGNAIERARRLAGATDPDEAAPGTIRGDFGIDLPRNSVHASDCVEAAEREIALVFGPER